MLSKNSFQTFAREIVQSFYPAQLDLFDLECESIIESIYSGQLSRNSGRDRPGELEFSPDAALLALKFIPALWATYKTIQEIVRYASERRTKAAPADSDPLQRSWERQLEAAGVSPPIAASIVQKFSKDLATHLVSAKR